MGCVCEGEGEVGCACSRGGVLVAGVVAAEFDETAGV